MKLKDFVIGKEAHFVEFHGGNLFYEIDGKFRFPVPIVELDGASVRATENASVFLKWIRRTLKLIGE